MKTGKKVMFYALLPFALLMHGAKKIFKFIVSKFKPAIAMLVLSAILLSSFLVFSVNAQSESNSVAQVNSTKYTNLEDAVAAFNSQGGTFTLLTDCEKNLNVGEVWITLSSSGTFDLNGHTLRANGGSAVIVTEVPYNELIITDTSVNEIGKITGNSSYSVWHEGDGDVYINGGTYINFLRYGSGSLIINKGVFVSEFSMNVFDDNAKVILNGGVFERGIRFNIGNQNIHELLGDGKTYMVDGEILSRDYVESLGDVYEIGTGKRVEIINEAAPEYTAPTPKTTLVYNNEEQRLVNEGSATGGTMQYALGTATEPTDSFRTNIPLGKNVQTYYVWYRVLGDDTHHTIAPKCIEVIIGKGALLAQDFTFNAPSNTTYDGNKKNAEVSVNTHIVGAGNITIKYYDENGTLLDGVPIYAGTYSVAIDVNEGENYTAASNLLLGTFKIETADISAAQVTLSCDSFTYDGQSQKPQVTVTFNGKALTDSDYELYFMSKSLVMTWEGGKPKKFFGKTQSDCKDVNQYFAVVYGKGNFTKNSSFAYNEFAINKADQAKPAVSKTDETISGKNDGKITDVTADMEYRADGEETYTTITGESVKNLADGKYYVRVKSNNNHNPSPDTEVTISAGRMLTVTYKADGKVVKTAEVEYGKDALAPAIPEKEGYTKTAPTWNNDGKNITEDTEINAVYTVNEYTITFMDENGVHKTLTLKHGETVEMPVAPTKEGYTATWETNIDKATGDTTVKAVYTENFSSSSKEEKSPQTGDNSNLWLWIILAIVSSGLFFGTILWNKKEVEEK